MNKGKIVQVMGPVIDVEFENNDLPYIKDALEVDNNGKKCVMEVAQHIGNNTVRCIMLENGAEIYRVEETINYILKTSGLKTIQSFVLSTGFMISLDDPKIDALNVVRRVNKNGVNLNVIALVNDISRKFYKGEITLKQAFSQLKHIETRQYPWWLNNICTIGVMVFFTGMFGGNWADMGANLIVGLVLTIWIDIGKKIELNSLIKDMLASIVLSATASILTKIYPVLHLNLVIIGALY